MILPFQSELLFGETLDDIDVYQGADSWRQEGIAGLGHLGDLLLQVKSHSALMGNVAITMSTQQELVWVLNLKSALTLTRFWNVWG